MKVEDVIIEYIVSKCYIDPQEIAKNNPKQLNALIASRVKDAFWHFQCLLEETFKRLGYPIE